MSAVAIDARDAFIEPLRGWGRYARDLIGHLPPDLETRVFEHGGAGPEVWFEQVTLPRALRRERAALVHATNCFLPLRRPCPGVVTIHDLAFEAHPGDFARKTGAKYRFFAPRAARGAQRVICVSEYTAGDVVRRYGIDAARIRVIPNAPSLPIGTGRVGSSSDGEPYLLAVGDLRAKKNLRRLVEAWGRLETRHRLVLAGLGELPGLPAGVETVGYVDDDRLDALMRGAAALVHPSLYEGFGLVVLEAMARGVPVVAADATALPETGGDAAVYFDPLDSAAMARAIDEALQARADLAERGRARAAQFSWRRTAEETAAVYRELL
jgi:glycosyltransferase involved in cell wall biosynthesis